MPVVARRIVAALSVVILSAAAVFVSFQSPLNPTSIHYPDAESSLFFYAASQLLDGNMLYRDVFDFHGPLVFVINAFGLIIGEALGNLFGGAFGGILNGANAGVFGVWLLELFFLVVTLLVIFGTLCRSVNPLTACLVCLVFVSFVGYSLQGGNHIEEYALLLQALGLAGFVDYFLGRRLSILSVYLIGVSVALMFCLEPLLTVFWLPFLLTIAVLLFRREGPSLALTKLLTIILSIVSVLILIIPWLYVANALNSCIDQMGRFYGEYLSLISKQERVDALLFFVGQTPFVLVVFISLSLMVKLALLRHKSEIVRGEGGIALRVRRALSWGDAPFGRNTGSLVAANLVAAVATVWVLAVSGRMEERLVLPMLVCLVIPLAFVLHYAVRAVLNKEVLRIALGTVLAVLLVVAVGIPGFGAAATLAQQQREKTRELAAQQELVAALRGFDSGDGEPIIVFGNDCWVYTAAGSYSATRYAYQPFGAGFRSDLNNDFYRQVRVADADLLVGRANEGLIEKYPEISNYEKVFQNASYELYRKTEPPTEPEPEPEDDASNGSGA
jgi:hypothetical protein